MKHIILTDIHFGAKGNSDEFNEQCIEFLKFVKQKSSEIIKVEDLGETIFMGDWFHHRSTINVKTLNFGIQGLQILSEIGYKGVKFILGNHDLYYRERRDIFSIPSIKTNNSEIQIIDKPTMDDNGYLYCPWLIGEEKLTDLIHQYNPTYVFGHFEIPTFSFNKLSKYDGEFNPSDYKGPKRILSGHFHLRQEKNNITYIGNCFSHDFSDANDWKNKGFAVLDTETNEITYYEWKDAPKYCVSTISNLNSIELENNTFIKLINDVNMKQIDLNKLKEDLLSVPMVKDCFIIPNQFDISKCNDKTTKINQILDLENIIIDLLKNLDISNINNDKLIETYNSLKSIIIEN